MTPEVRNNVSKLVRSRLAHVPVAGPHPDAGLLTAFAERALADREREDVLAHLATCADCREVVALAAPEPLEGLAAAAPAPGRVRWLTMPVMQWGAVAAAVAVVAVAVVMESPRMQQPLRSTPQSNSDQAVVSRAEKPAPAQPPTAMSASAGKERERDAAVPSVKTAEVKPNNQVGRDELATRRDDLAKQKKEDGSRTLAAAPPVPVVSARIAEADKPPAGNKAGEAHVSRGVVGGVTGAAVAQAERNEEPRDKDAKLERRPAEQQAMAKPAAPTAAYDATESYPAAAKAAPSPESAPTRRAAGGAGTSGGLYGPAYTDNGNMAAQGATMDSRRAQFRSVVLRWTVTSDGRVQRSRDAGHSWADVHIAKDKEVKFRALVTQGDEVWAGGSQGALYYSADAGGTWLAHPLESVSGDIIRMNVNGKTLVVSTSSGQTIELSHDVFGEAPNKPADKR